MFPTIPEDRADLSAVELRALAESLRVAIRDALAEHGSTVLAEAQEAQATRRAILAEAEAIELADSLADSDLSEDESDDEASDESDDDAADESSDDTADDTADEASNRTVNIGLDLDSQTTEDNPQGGPLTAPMIHSFDRVNGREAGTPFGNWLEFANHLMDRADSFKPSASEKVLVGEIRGRYDEAHTLTGDPFDDASKLQMDLSDPNRDELIAACCAPLEPQYDLACQNTLRRPVKGSLATYSAPRGGVTIYPSPTLEDVAGGAGIWTCEMDADPETPDKGCATIECEDSIPYQMYGVYYCLTVQNLLALTFPELVAAYLNRVAALHARIAEIQLLDQMSAGIIPVMAAQLGYGATTSVTTQIIEFLALRREQQRWDDVPMVGWAHRYLREALRIDLSRRNRQDGSFRLASAATVDQAFMDAGVDINWFIDTPSWAAPVGPVSSGGDPSEGTLPTLGTLPNEADILIAPRGKFRVIDRAATGIGLTGNNVYRDNESNRRNNFTFFFENYEGIVDTDTCPATLLHFEGLCFNGVQVANVALDCEGFGEGAGSV